MWYHISSLVLKNRAQYFIIRAERTSALYFNVCARSKDCRFESALSGFVDMWSKSTIYIGLPPIPLILCYIKAGSQSKEQIDSW